VTLADVCPNIRCGADPVRLTREQRQQRDEKALRPFLAGDEEQDELARLRAQRKMPSSGA
jgi:hypothetical protein